MENFKCIIVDDEPIAARIIADYVADVPFLSLTAVCEDALAALEILKREPIDVIFLDIQMPRLRGIDFAKSLRTKPQIIFTTAHRDYAIEAFELEVVDYLLKPISFSRFLMAVNKLLKDSGAHNYNSSAAQSPPQKEKPSIFFNVNKKMVRVYFDDITYVESIKEYVKIKTGVRSIITKMQLSDMEEILGKENFLRIHRSFIVAKDKIEAYSSTEIEIAGERLTIGRNYKEMVYAVLGSRIK